MAGERGRERYPDRLLPSEYFRRQVYAMFRFEKESLELLPKYQAHPGPASYLPSPNNVMFETDFPHPTSLHPGPAGLAEVIRRDTEIMGDAVLRKVLQDNACRVYHIE